jgi:thiol-disulfide isomerase/thioredoxin
MYFKLHIAAFFICLTCVSCTSNIPESNNSKHTQVQIKSTTTDKLVDTNLVFNSLEDFYAYHRNMQKEILEHCAQLKATALNGNYLADSTYAHFQELFLVALYRNLQHLPKEKKEFYALYSLFELSTLLDYDKKKALFMKFPENLRNSEQGRKTLIILEKKARHVNKAITDYPDLPLTDAHNNKTQLFNLLSAKKKKLMVMGATWCSPCSYENQKIFIAITNNKIDTNKVDIIHISIDEDRNKWVESLKKPPFWLHTYNCAKGLSEKFFTTLQVVGVPHYILINEENLIIHEGRNIEEILPHIK